MAKLERLIEAPAGLPQLAVMHRASLIPDQERGPGKELLVKYLGSEAIEESCMIRCSQILCAWLPGTIEVVLALLADSASDVQFALICALTDVETKLLVGLQSKLLPTIWNVISTSADSNLEYIGTEIVPRFETAFIGEVLDNNRSDLSDFLKSRLAEKGLLQFVAHPIKSKPTVPDYF